MLKKLFWFGVALLGAFAFAGIALNRGETINAMWIIVASVCVYALGYRFYSAWILTEVLVADITRATPADRFNDGHDFVPTHNGCIRHALCGYLGSRPLIVPR